MEFFARMIFPSVDHCARIPPAQRPVEPEARESFSMSMMFRCPESARWKAVAHPMTPPPMMTTS